MLENSPGHLISYREVGSMMSFLRRPAITTLVDDHVELSDAQVDDVLRDVLEIYGYDFTNYSRASFKRRVTRLFNYDRFLRFDDFRFRLRTEREYFGRFLEQVTVTVTEMFRDSSFYRMLREHVLPSLAEAREIRIWHAGCSTGEEVFSMAILLHECNMLNRSQLFATDINPAVLERVRSGIFSMSAMSRYAENYKLSGGQLDFSSYYRVHKYGAVFSEFLGERTTASVYNLVSGNLFDQFHLILCRNVLIYFDKPLQDRILHLFSDSLVPGGYLGLGSKETLKFTDVERGFKQLGVEKLWRSVPANFR